MSDRSLTTTEEKLQRQLFFQDIRSRIAHKRCLEREHELLESKRRLWAQIIALRHENNLFRLQLGMPRRQYNYGIPPLLRSASLEHEPEKILHF